MLDLLQLRTRDQPEHVAYIFLQDGEHTEIRLTYAELDRRARSIASLMQRWAVPGERVLLLYPPGLDYLAAFFGCLYAGLVAVPAYPPHPQRPMPRLQAILADAEASLALTAGTLLAQLEPRFVQFPDLAKLRWLSTDTQLDGLAEQWQMPQVTPATLAMLQYTSGSTSAPKGVMLSHGELLHNQRMIQAGFEHTQNAVVMGWLPLYHDMGLIGNVLQPLYLGTTCILMSPVAFLQRPVRWLEAITRYRATTSGGPSFAYDLCARKITPEQRAHLDLRSWNLAFCGAEPVRAATLARFTEVFAPCGFRYEAFYPCYGLAEATLIVSGGRKHTPPIVQTVGAAALERDRVIMTAEADPGGRALVGCGQPLLDLRLEIVQPETLTRCAPGEVGEIWVAGPSVAQGYWNQPDATAQTFGAHLADTGAGPFLRTGDLGFVQDGELFITGRLKDLIILRGRNHYPQDIELTVEESHPLVRSGSGAAFSVEVGDDEQLVIVQEVERQGLRADLTEVIASIRQSIAEQHEVSVSAVVLIKPATIPKTSSGKIQRHACRAAFRDGTLATVAAWHATEQPALASERDDPQPMPHGDDPVELQAWLSAHVARVCGVAVEEIAIDQPITRYGLDSMLAIAMLHGIETHTGVLLSMATLMLGPSIRQLAVEIAVQRTAPAADPLLAAAAGTMEHLSYGQRALWFLHQIAPESTAYTIANAVQIDASLDGAALKRAAQMLIDRHPQLRAVFPARHGEPFQQVRAQQPVAFVHEDATAWDVDLLQQRLREVVEQPFDLERGPLLRITLFTHDERRHTLLLAAHHSVTDFWSQALLLQELDTLYAAALADQAPVLPPTAQYGEYVAWQQTQLSSATGVRLWEYWRQQLRAAPTVLNLPTDRPRPPVQTFQGAAHSFTLGAELTGALKRFGEAQGVTLYMLLLTAFNVLLHRYTGHDDLLIGSPMAGRSRAWFANVVGYFVNLVALRASFSVDLTCAALLQQVRKTVLAAFEHQDFPFPLLVERLQPDRDPSRPPLVQALFALQPAPPHAPEQLAALALGIDGIEVALETLPLRSVALPHQAAQFELGLVVADIDGCLRGSWQYNSDLFEPATIERMARHWERVLRALIAEPAQCIGTLTLLTETEQRQLLGELAGTTANYPRDQTLHALIETQVERLPETIAVVWGDRSLTYAELNRRANQLAHHLRGLGVGPDRYVGLCVERSADALIGILGILKAGGAYVPLDPSYPAERLAWMLSNSGIDVLITQTALLDSLPPLTATTLCLDRDLPAIAQAAEHNPGPIATPENVAYVLHTSGSTGRPKGVCCQHTGVVNLCYDFQRRQPLSAGMACSWWTSLSFDVSVLEIFSALLAGGTLHIVPEYVRFDGAAFVHWLQRHQVQCAYIPAFMLPDLIATVDAGVAPPLRRMVVGVEPIQEQLLVRIMCAIPGLQILNGYGPTETTICATAHAVDPLSVRDDITPLGTTVQHMQVYLLDRQLQPVPIGVLGEIYIGGVGLARGYAKQPALTAARFVPNPFGHEVGARLYRTGDLARYRADGCLMFAGRRDYQIKLRGYRIELGEIEQALMQHPHVREVVVVVREAGSGDARLVAYVVENYEDDERSTKNQEDDGSRLSALNASELRGFLHKMLPDYMVPSAFVVLDALPRLLSGKVDRQALPLPDAAFARSTAGYRAPQNEIEKLIAAIWQETLHVERVGMHDNFFELGGHSLLVAQVHTKLQAALGIDLPLTALFKHPTVERLADYLSQERDQDASFQRSADRAALRKEARRNRRRTSVHSQSHESDEDG